MFVCGWALLSRRTETAVHCGARARSPGTHWMANQYRSVRRTTRRVVETAAGRITDLSRTRMQTTDVKKDRQRHGYSLQRHRSRSSSAQCTGIRYNLGRASARRVSVHYVDRATAVGIWLSRENHAPTLLHVTRHSGHGRSACADPLMPLQLVNTASLPMVVLLRHWSARGKAARSRW